MPDILPRDLDPAAVVPSDAALISDDGVSVLKATPAQIVDTGAPVASQAEAVTGVENSKRMTALRVKQAFDAYAVSIPAGNVAANLAALEIAPTTNTAMYYDGAWFSWTLGNFTAQAAASPGDYIESDNAPLTTGAWVRQRAAKMQFVQAGTGAVFLSAQSKMRDFISVKDFGAIADGDPHPLSERFATLAAAQAYYPFVASLSQQIDWAACQAAVNLFPMIGQDDPVDSLTCGGTVYFPRGVYYLGDDTITVANNPTYPAGSYSFGPKLRGDRAVLVPGAGSMAAIALIGAEAGAEYVGGTSVEGFHFDCTAPTDIDSVGLLLRNVYMCDFRDLTFRGGGGPGQGSHHIWLDQSGSSVSFHNCKGGNIRITGLTLLGHVPPLIWTTINWYNCWFTKMDVSSAWDISWFGGGMQSAAPVDYCFKLTNATDIAVFGGDYESSSPTCVLVDCSTPGVEGVQNLNLLPNVTGSLQGGFIRGEAQNAFMPRQYGRPYGGWLHGNTLIAVTDASATTILDFTGDPKLGGNNFRFATVKVRGSNGSFGWCDTVEVAYGVVVYDASKDARTFFGSPPTRTYTFDAATASLKLQLGGGGASHFVRASSHRVPY